MLCDCAGRHVLFIIIMLNVIMVSVVVPNVIMMSVLILSVMVPSLKTILPLSLLGPMLLNFLFR